jgi:hypothetical protein
MANIYHDVIHDYGPGSSNERWEKVQKQLLQFEPDRFTILVGGVRFVPLSRRGSMITDSSRKSTFKTPKSYLLSAKSKPYESTSTIKKTTTNDITDILELFVESVNAKICFNTFNAYAHSLVGVQSAFANIFDSEDDEDYYAKKYNSGVDKLYNRIAYYVRLHGYKDISSIFSDFTDLDPDNNPNNLFANLDKFIFVSIYDTATNEENEKSRTRTIRGGAARTADEKLSVDKLAELIAELTDEKDRLEMQIDQIYDAFLHNPTEYATLRKNALNSTKDILRRYLQMKKAGTVDNASSSINKCCFIPPIPRSARQANKTIEQFSKECFLDYYNIALIDYYTEHLNGLRAEEEAIRIRVERESSGEFTKSQRMVRNQFCSVIAKLGLVLNGEYNPDGNQMLVPTSPGIDDTMTAKEVNLLANWANWKWNSDFHQTRIYQSNARTNIDLELFNTTYNYFSDNRINTGEHPVCNRSAKYIIDNATIVPNHLKSYVFCPASSVVDGMKKCVANQLEEYGNMDFVFCEMDQQHTSLIQPTKLILRFDSAPLSESSNTYRYASGVLRNKIPHYYNGRSTYDRKTGSVEYVMEIKTPYIGKTPITLSKKIPLAGTTLEAHNVLRETLVKILEFIVDLQKSYPERSGLIYQNQNGIFGGLYENLFNSDYKDKLPTLKNKFLNAILNILFKGSGDLFQEINAVCKWGGYSFEREYTCDRGVLPYNSNSLGSDGNGNALRMFIANDQPSGCRFAFLLLNGHPDFINEYAFGGYMGTGKTLIVTREDIRDGQFKRRICLPNQMTSSGISQSTKTSKKSRRGGKKSRKIRRI